MYSLLMAPQLRKRETKALGGCSSDIASSYFFLPSKVSSKAYYITGRWGEFRIKQKKPNPNPNPEPYITFYCFS